jgi:hypothetical protein
MLCVVFLPHLPPIGDHPQIGYPVGEAQGVNPRLLLPPGAILSTRLPD